MGKKDDMKKRTWEFALRCIKLCKALPNSFEGRHNGGQLLRSRTSVAANYRASQLAQSHKTLIVKMRITARKNEK